MVSSLDSSCEFLIKHLQRICIGGSSITMLPRLRSKFSDLELLWKVECMQYSKEGEGGGGGHLPTGVYDWRGQDSR